MKAAWYTETGTARAVLNVGDLPDPQPGPGEVRVRVHGSGLSPTDMYTRSGIRTKVLAFPRITPHQDGAGVIDAVGEGVAKSRIGERVLIYMAQWQRGDGTAAEYCCLPSQYAVPLPANCDFVTGACLGVPWLTAHWALAADGPVKGQTVLVAGGTGAVGYYAVQIAKAWGARVIATVGSAQKAGVAKEAGADEVIDYRAEDVGACVGALTGGQGVDRLLEVNLGMNAALLPAVMKKGGVVVVYGSTKPEAVILPNWGIRNRALIRFIYMYELPPEEYVAAWRDFTAMQTDGKLKHLPIREYTLADIASAHEAVEAGNSGTRNVVVPVRP